MPSTTMPSKQAQPVEPTRAQLAQPPANNDTSEVGGPLSTPQSSLIALLEVNPLREAMETCAFCVGGKFSTLMAENGPRYGFEISKDYRDWVDLGAVGDPSIRGHVGPKPFPVEHSHVLLSEIASRLPEISRTHVNEFRVPKGVVFCSLDTWPEKMTPPLGVTSRAMSFLSSLLQKPDNSAVLNIAVYPPNHEALGERIDTRRFVINIGVKIPAELALKLGGELQRDPSALFWDLVENPPQGAAGDIFRWLKECTVDPIVDHVVPGADNALQKRAAAELQFGVFHDGDGVLHSRNSSASNDGPSPEVKTLASRVAAFLNSK